MKEIERNAWYISLFIKLENYIIHVEIGNVNQSAKIRVTDSTLTLLHIANASRMTPRKQKSQDRKQINSFKTLLYKS